MKTSEMMLNGVRWRHGRLSLKDGRLSLKDGRLALKDGRLSLRDGKLSLKDGRLAWKNFIHIFYLEHLRHTFGGPWLSNPFSMSHEDDYFCCCLISFRSCLLECHMCHKSLHQ
ncbi:hypothetical protein BsWGS_23819 [Bradybaena similaris]